MNLEKPFYPLKIISRCLPVARTNKLRVSWFLIGLIAGVGTTLTATSGLSPMLPAIQTTTAPVAASKPEPQTVALAEPAAPVTLQKETPQPLPTDDTTYPLTLTLTVENGDTLIDMLTDAGVTAEEAHSLVQAMGKSYNAKKLNIGQMITIELDKNPRNPGTPIIQNVVLPLSAVASLEIRRTPKDTFEIKKIQEPVSPKVKRAQANIHGSFYETAAKAGLSPALIAELITAYSYDVDFQRDVQRNDTLDVLYERMETAEGIAAGYGSVLYANLDLGNRSYKVYRYVDKNGKADYYNAKGESVRKALLRTPINGAKITSRYGMRNHPVLGYSKMHRGVDFGAPTGTPVYAAGDGTVGFASRKGGYGNYLMIRHNGTYGTAYGHLSRFARGITPGKKVKQGQIVAYVGSTGISTGPHLHYEVLMHDKQVNPSGVKFKTGTVLAGKELASFRKTMETIEAHLASNEKLAMATSDKKPEVR
jgi:murein DD-endopeptidase MepM/ murein hydrolase activator NlpD